MKPVTPLLPKPRRGDIWRVNLDPKRGSEADKIRPSIVMSVNGVGVLPVKVVVPLTGWDDRYERSIWHVRIDPSPTNGLTKSSSADAMQIRTVSLERFVDIIGHLTEEQMSDVASAVAIVLGIQ
jgi:mRNA interferase MazF